MTLANDGDTMRQVEAYRAKVADYEKLQGQIDILLKKNNNDTNGLSNASLSQYQSLARQRDEALNEIRWLEQQLLDNDIN